MNASEKSLEGIDFNALYAPQPFLADNWYQVFVAGTEPEICKSWLALSELGRQKKLASMEGTLQDLNNEYANCSIADTLTTPFKELKRQKGAASDSLASFDIFCRRLAELSNEQRKALREKFES